MLRGNDSRREGFCVHFAAIKLTAGAVINRPSVEVVE